MARRRRSRVRAVLLLLLTAGGTAAYGIRQRRLAANAKRFGLPF